LKLSSIFALGLLALASCASTHAPVEALARAQVTADFATYQIHRVGLLPIAGRSLDSEQKSVLEGALFTEFSNTTSYEVVPLQREDLEELNLGSSYLRGHYDPAAVIEIARRFRLDGAFVTTVTDYQFYAPQRLSVQVDLVASETGAAIWSSSLHLDATVDSVQRAVQAFYENSGSMDNESGNGWEIALLSPRLFAQFACWQLARLL
jgi:hypothetical protein